MINDTSILVRGQTSLSGNTNIYGDLKVIGNITGITNFGDNIGVNANFTNITGTTYYGTRAILVDHLYIGGNVNQIFIGSTAKLPEITHEIGHAIFDEFISTNIGSAKTWERLHNLHLQNGDFITARSSVNEAEHFADSIRFYMLEPQILRYKHP